MIVKCIANTKKDLLQNSKKDYSYYNEDYKFNLKIGKNYIVHGIKFYNNKWTYIFGEPEDPYPDFCPVELFEIVDHSINQMFHANIKIVKDDENQESSKESISATFSYKEMAINEYHYEDIVIPDEREDADPDAREKFYKRIDEINELEKEKEKRIKNFKA